MAFSTKKYAQGIHKATGLHSVFSNLTVFADSLHILLFYAILFLPDGPAVKAGFAKGEWR